MHGASIVPQAERDALVPAFARGTLGCDEPEAGDGPDANGAAVRHRRERDVVLLHHDGLLRVSHEFGDGAEGAETPARCRIGHLGCQKTRHVAAVAQPPVSFAVMRVATRWARVLIAPVEQVVDSGGLSAEMRGLIRSMK